jgi:hypothetical protein
MINCLLDVAKGLPDVATRAGILNYFRYVGPRQVDSTMLGQRGCPQISRFSS